MKKTLSVNQFRFPSVSHVPEGDPFQWLEEVEDEKALNWVKKQNDLSAKELTTTPEFKKLEGDILEVYDSTARIPYISKHGDYYYNFWKDATNTKGLWRRTTLDQYRKSEIEWEILLDLDALAESENENWVWHGSEILKNTNLVLINLSLVVGRMHLFIESSI